MIEVSSVLENRYSSPTFQIFPSLNIEEINATADSSGSFCISSLKSKHFSIISYNRIGPFVILQIIEKGYPYQVFSGSVQF